MNVNLPISTVATFLKCKIITRIVTSDVLHRQTCIFPDLDFGSTVSLFLSYKPYNAVSVHSFTRMLQFFFATGGPLFSPFTVEMAMKNLVPFTSYFT